MQDLVNKLAKGIHKIKCKYRHDDKKCEICGIKYKDCECCLEYTIVKNNLIGYKCLCCNKNDQIEFDENIKQQFFNTYNYSDHDINKFILLLRNSVYPYEQMDNSEKFDEKLFPKEDYHIHLHAKEACKDFEIKQFRWIS